MNFEKLVYWVLVLISITTIVSGIMGIVAPAFILGLLSAEINAATRHCFATVGMFMFLFGAMLLQVLLSRQMSMPVFLWAGMQKIGASIAMGAGIIQGVYSSRAVLVACFDLLSGILIFIYMKLAPSQQSTPLRAVERTLP